MIEIYEHSGEGYLPLIDFQSWRVAILRYNKRFCKLTGLERHLETDEVFVLLEGDATLVAGEPGNTTEYKMERNKIYNIPKGVWHHIIVTPDAYVLIVENSDTSVENTERIAI